MNRGMAPLLLCIGDYPSEKDEDWLVPVHRDPMRRMTMMSPNMNLPGSRWRQLGVMLCVFLHAGRPYRFPFASFASFVVRPVSAHEVLFAKRTQLPIEPVAGCSVPTSCNLQAARGQAVFWRGFPSAASKMPFRQTKPIRRGRALWAAGAPNRLGVAGGGAQARSQLGSVAVSHPPPRTGHFAERSQIGFSSPVADCARGFAQDINLK
jgi:hypothetical protein